MMILQSPKRLDLNNPEDVKELGISFGYKWISGEDVSEERGLIKQLFKMKWSKFWSKSTLGKAITFWQRKEEDD